jgi:SHS2 domain-containing protein
MPYQTIDHAADIGIAVQADNAGDLFKEAARALSELIFGKRTFAATETVTLTIKGSDWPDLMVNWLRELLFLVNGKQLFFGSVTIRKISEFTLSAAVAVNNTSWAPHDMFNEIKAVTYHQIQAEKQAAGWRARIIFDV